MTQSFTSAGDYLAGLDPNAAGALLTAATDVALIVSADGVIEDISVNADGLSLEGSIGWVGKPWRDTVTVESRNKVESLLKDAMADKAPRWRHINHPAGNGNDVPIVYSAIRIGDGDRLICVGRDMRPVAELQRRLVDAQHSMEREYSRLRNAESGFRALFEQSSEPVLITDASTRTVVEANAAAGEMLGATPEQLVGSFFPRDFDAPSTESIRTLLNVVESGAQSPEVEAYRSNGDGPIKVSASLLRQDERAHFIVRLNQIKTHPGQEARMESAEQLLEVLDRLPDGVVVTTSEGDMVAANRTFLDMVGVSNEALARNEPIDQWVGLPGVDVPVLLANLRQRGTVRLFRTVLLDAQRARKDVEISAVTVPNDGSTSYAFAVRDISSRVESSDAAEQTSILPRSVEQLSALVGRVPLKELVREATDLVEKLCIQAALELSGNNRASTADLLGLSRQSLYIKLRRHGIGNLDSGN